MSQINTISLTGSLTLGGSRSIIIPKTLTANGTYSAGTDNADGYSPVTVDVSPNLETLNVTENGSYTPPVNVDGFDEVNVAVPIPALSTLSVTRNGTYNAPSNSGYNVVNVNVPPGNNFNVIALRKSITDSGGSGTYHLSDYYYGIDLTDKTIFTDMRYMYANGSNYYNTTYTRTITDSNTWSDSWGYISGNGYVLANVYCAPTSAINVLADYQNFTSNQNYVFDIPTEAQSLDVSHFFVDFESFESGGFSMDSAISKTIVNNQLVINFGIPVNNRSVRARIIYVF